ncbi:hypothetical protein SNK04_008987 [Fusarium graminearum]
MDLRSVLNTSEGGDRAPVKSAPKPQPPPPVHQHQQQPHPQQQQQQQQMQRPSQSPAQAPASHPYYREYNRQPPPHPSPGKPMPQEYLPHAAHPHHPQSRPPSHHQPSPHQPPPGAYPPQSPYQAPGPYPGRPVPPPLQPGGSFHDARSPSGPTPGQSPYRASTTPSAATAAAGYPFPHTQSPAEVASPVQRHQHSPAQYPPRESFSQGPQVIPLAMYMAILQLNNSNIIKTLFHRRLLSPLQLTSNTINALPLLHVLHILLQLQHLLILNTLTASFKVVVLLSLHARLLQNTVIVANHPSPLRLSLRLCPLGQGNHPSLVYSHSLRVHINKGFHTQQLLQ